MNHDKVALALDRASTRAYDVDGHLHVSRTPISKANVCGYGGSEIPGWQQLGLDANRTYQLYRDPVELEKAVPTFAGKPLLLGHKAVTADAHDYEKTVGAVTNPEWEAPYIYAALDVWPGPAIKGIENEDWKELSPAYRYEPDMTPGVTPDGIRYDGRMTNIVGNHVALVPEGRTGPDVVVGDQALPKKEMFSMTKVALTKTAAVAQGALAAYLLPLLAADAKIDLSPVVAKVTAKNFKASHAAIAADVAKVTVGKIAADKNLDGLPALLTALDAMCAKDEDDDEDDKKKNPFAKDGEETEEEKKDREAKEKLAKDEDDKAIEEAKGKRAMDAVLKGFVSKADMEKTIATAVTVAVDAATKAGAAIRDAEKFVRPWVGDLAIAHDSAEAVYRTALTTMGVDGADKLHVDALRPVLQAQPVPGAIKKTARIAQDAAAVEGYAKRFPNANRLK